MDLTTIGKKVLYKGKKGELRGVVKDEVLIKERESYRDILSVIQHIQFEDEYYGIRFCYYSRRHGPRTEKWVFANRPLSISDQALKRLLKKASKKKWFAKII